MRSWSGLVAAAAGLWLASAAFAADEPGSQDHPLVGRYEGATIVFYKSAEFDEATLLQAPHDYAALLARNATDDRSGDEWLQLEGRVTKIRYELPTGRSSLEALRNHESALKANGFTVTFRCADKACFSGDASEPYMLGAQVDTDNGINTRYFDRVRYLLAKLDHVEGSVHVAILAGEAQQLTSVFVMVVESGAMEGDKIAFIDAGQMAQAIAQEQRINVYGIVFDFDKDTLRPESRPTLDEIARLLTERPELNLNIVGHTDDRGTPEYNMNLSQRRAANVVAALTRDYGIAPERLTASGAGLTSPIAPNDTEEGRAKNRRVELVAR